MLTNHPTLKHIVRRAGWYFVTFLVAVTINFILPRLGDANPVDTIMARVSAGLDAGLGQGEGRGLPQGVQPGRGRRSRQGETRRSRQARAHLARAAIHQLLGHEPCAVTSAVRFCSIRSA